MAEKINQGASRAADAHSRPLPFAPIFDTIVAEPLSKTPFTIKEPTTKVTSPREKQSGSLHREFLPDEVEGTGFNGPAHFHDGSKPGEVASHPARLSVWIIGIGVFTILLGVIYLNWQFSRENYALSDLSNSTSKIATVLSDDRKLEQRPWVNIADMVPQPLAVAPGAFNVSLQNSGKTAALDVKVSATAQLTGSDVSGNQAMIPVIRDTGGLFAGSQFKTVLDFRPSPAVLAQLYRGRGRLEIHIDVTYRDVLQASHVSQSCWSWQPAFRQMEACPGYGSVN
jgi:hypothetical protein